MTMANVSNAAKAPDERTAMVGPSKKILKNNKIFSILV